MNKTLLEYPDVDTNVEEDEVETSGIHQSIADTVKWRLLKMKPLTSCDVPNHVHTNARFVSQVLCRQKQAHQRIYCDQLLLGRPDHEFRRCFEEECRRQQCLYEDVPYHWTSQLQSAGGILVADYETRFIAAMVLELYGEVATTTCPRYVAIESFMNSPPVIGMFCWFAHSAKRGEYCGSPKNLAQTVTRMHKSLCRMVGSTSHNLAIQYGHESFWHLKKDWRPQHWQFIEYIREFFMTVESWRRYSLRMGYRPDWDFGSDETTAALLEAIFLNMWAMWLDQCKVMSKGVGAVDQWWELWLGQFPPAWSEVDQSHREKKMPGETNKTTEDTQAALKSDEPDESVKELNPRTQRRLRHPGSRQVALTDEHDPTLGEESEQGQCGDTHLRPIEDVDEEGCLEGHGVARPCWIYGSLWGNTISKHRGSRKLFKTGDL